jgi:preprotein translocase subunit SecE
VARETRRQRRDARRAAGEQSGGGSGITRPPRLRTAEAGGPGDGPGDGGASFGGAPAISPVLSQRPGTRRFSFLRESVGELKKVEWPSRAQVVQGTVVVLIACAIVGVFLYGADQALRPFVQHVLLNQ